MQLLMHSVLPRVQDVDQDWCFVRVGLLRAYADDGFMGSRPGFSCAARTILVCCGAFLANMVRKCDLSRIRYRVMFECVVSLPVFSSPLLLCSAVDKCATDIQGCCFEWCLCSKLFRHQPPTPQNPPTPLPSSGAPLLCHNYNLPFFL